MIKTDKNVVTGLESIYIAEDLGNSYGELIKLSGSREFNLTINRVIEQITMGKNISKTIKDKIVDASINLDFVNIPIEIEAKLEGATLDENGGYATKVNSNKPNFAIMLVRTDNKNLREVLILYNCRIHTNNISGSTKNKEINFKTVQMAATAIAKENGLFKYTIKENLNNKVFIDSMLNKLYIPK